MAIATAADFAAWAASEQAGDPITSPSMLLPRLIPLLTQKGKPLEEERLALLCLNNANCVVAQKILSTGGASMALMDPVVIFRRVLRTRGATAFALAHNHPSGDPTPSRHDIQSTVKLAQAAKILHLNFVDHLILGAGGKYTSLREQGYIQ